MFLCNENFPPFYFQMQIKSKDERVEELEEALRESVSITAEREGVLAKESENVRNLLKEVRLCQDWIMN